MQTRKHDRLWRVIYRPLVAPLTTPDDAVTPPILFLGKHAEVIWSPFSSGVVPFPSPRKCLEQAPPRTRRVQSQRAATSGTRAQVHAGLHQPSWSQKPKTQLKKEKKTSAQGKVTLKRTTTIKKEIERLSN